MGMPEALALDDFIEEGRALETVIRMVGEAHQAHCDPVREKAEKCRLIALGIIDSALLQAGDLVIGRALEKHLEYCLTCFCAFVQGAPISNVSAT